MAAMNCAFCDLPISRGRECPVVGGSPRSGVGGYQPAHPGCVSKIRHNVDRQVRGEAPLEYRIDLRDPEALARAVGVLR